MVSVVIGSQGAFAGHVGFPVVPVSCREGQDICPTAKNGRKVVITERHGRQRADLAAAKGRLIGFHGREGLVRRFRIGSSPLGFDEIGKLRAAFCAVCSAVD